MLFRSIAHYYCEQAELAILDNNLALARRYVAKTLNCDQASVRGSILLGRIESMESRHVQAIQAWKCVEQQDPLYLGEVAVQIVAAFRSLQDEAGLYEYFTGVLQRHADVSVLLALADIVKARDGVEAAEDFVARWLRKQPSVQGLHRLIQLNMVDADATTRADLALLSGIIERLMEQQQGYSCLHCGFSGNTLHWLCPACQRWNTIKPQLNMIQNPEETKGHV